MRRGLGLIRESVESPRETVMRLMIVFAHLPEPRCNQNIRSATGSFLARGDLVYSQFRILVEYDGWHHERDGRQRQGDLIRRKALVDEGWRVIIVTAEDMKSPRTVVHRVHRLMRKMSAVPYPSAAPRQLKVPTSWGLEVAPEHVNETVLVDRSGDLVCDFEQR